MLFTSSRNQSGRMHRIGGILTLGVLAGSLIFAVGVRAQGRSSRLPQIGASASTPPVPGAKVTPFASSAGLRFEPNQGQTDPRVKFLSRNPQYNLFLTQDEAVFSLQGPRPAPTSLGRRLLSTLHHAPPVKRTVVRMRLLGARPKTVTASDQIPGRTNYFIGRDPQGWIRNVPQYSRVNYDEIYRGVDMTFYGNQQAFEFDLIVKPGADPHQIALRFAGARKIKTGPDGDLVLASAAGDLALHKPVAYQWVEGKRQPVEATFVARGRSEFGLALGAYDHSRELVVDPTVLYSTYLGGSGSDDGHGVAVDSTGAVYVTGQTSSKNFPVTTGAAQSTLLGTIDAFVTKFTPDGSALVYSTYLGGMTQVGGDSTVGPTSSGNAIAVDSTGSAYIAGGTNTSDFPLCPAANNCPAPAQAAYAGGKGDAFAVKLDPNGGLAYATFIGGSDNDVAEGIAIDSNGNIYVGGQTQSTNLLVVSGLQQKFGGMTDGFIAKIDGTAASPTLGNFKFLDYLGGAQADTVTGIGLDQSNNIYVSGITISTDFPVHGSAPYQTKCGTDGNCNPTSQGAQEDSFVTAIKSDLSQYIYSTYFGGSGGDDAENMTVDASGDVFFTGLTSSTDLITGASNQQLPNTPYQSSLGSGATNNVYVAELNPTGSTVTYLTYLGGTGADVAFGIAVDANGRIYLTGQTTPGKNPQGDFPIVKEFQPALYGTSDAFVSLLDPSKTGKAQLVFSTYLGGIGAENTQNPGLAIDSSDNIYVTGDTASPTTGNGPFFPITTNAYQPTLKGTTAAFLTKISSTAVSPTGITVDVSAISPSTIKAGSSATSTVTVTSQNGYAGNVTLRCDLTPVTKVPPTCTFSAVSVAVPANGTAQATLTIGTVAPTASLHLGPALPMVAFVAAIPGLFAFKRRQRPYFLVFCLAITALLVMGGCASGTGTGGGGTPGTTAGTYNFTVTGAGVNTLPAKAPAQSVVVQ
jgi:Beta-propeller repeat